MMDLKGKEERKADATDESSTSDLNVLKLYPFDREL